MPHCVRNERLVAVPDLSHSLRSAPAAPLVWAARRGVRFRLLAALLGFECWGVQNERDPEDTWAPALLESAWGRCMTQHTASIPHGIQRNKIGWASAPRAP